MRPAGFIIVPMVLVMSLGLGPSARSDQAAGKGSAIDGEISETHQIRPASQSVRERQRERRRARRDRTRRRFARGGGEILPHFADYAIHESGFSTTRFKSAHGMLTVEMINNCDDWTLQEKWDLDLRDQDDQSHRSDLIYRASEVRSAKKFVFAYSREHLDERTDFIGDVLDVDGGFMARFQEPKIADAFMPDDLVFPITHLRQILTDARRGRSESEALVFDGANALPYRAVTAISQPLREDDPNPRVVAARTELDLQTSDRLPDGRHWPIRVDYFPLDDAFAAPILTREFLLHENGIILSFHFDYGDIQMDARLKILDIRDPIPCPN